MENKLIEIEIPFSAMLLTWLAVKLAAAAYLQRCYANLPRADTDDKDGSELKKLTIHFVKSFLIYPEATILWACVWPLFAMILWRWNPRDLLPATLQEYLEHRDGH